jgi:hypothetical protein
MEGRSDYTAKEVIPISIPNEQCGDRPYWKVVRKFSNFSFIPYLSQLMNNNRFLPSLDTQSCIKGLLVVRDFCFLAAGPVLKKKVWVDYEQLLRSVFLCFRGQKFFIFF